MIDGRMGAGAIVWPRDHPRLPHGARTKAGACFTGPDGHMLAPVREAPKSLCPLQQFECAIEIGGRADQPDLA